MVIMLFGWVAADCAADTEGVLHEMAAALRGDRGLKVALWGERGFGMGAVYLGPSNQHDGSPPGMIHAQSRYVAWMAGEAFAWDSEPLDEAVAGGRSQLFGRRLLARWEAEGPRSVRALDGEYQIAIWDRRERQLQLLLDRFGALPMYWAENSEGFAFAGGVRGVLVAPGVDARPDPDALREAVSFGGFRLGVRTNMMGVHMAPPSAVITSRAGRTSVARSWTWSEAPGARALPHADRLHAARCLWREAIRRRLVNSRRPGLTLSGGLDSRAILAEASRQTADISAVTYGVAQSDDVRFARRAARAAGASWELVPLYRPGWLEARLDHVLDTDGLLNLVDLMHLEAAPRIGERMDVCLHGFIGDVVSGGTYSDMNGIEAALSSLPYYGGRLGLAPDRARELVRAMIAAEGGARFLPYEHKFPQAVGRITAALRPWVRVRRPFTDYAFWEMAGTIPPELRRHHAWHESWLRATYPELFARIPHHRTAVPAGASSLRRHATRAARFAWRSALRTAAALGLPLTPPERTFHPDWQAWRVPDVRDAITSTILRPGSIAVEIFGRDALEATLSDYFDCDAAPAQVIGALCVYEHYHRALPACLSRARARGRESRAARRPLVASLDHPSGREITA